MQFLDDQTGEGNAADAGHALQASLVAATEPAAVVADGHDLQATAPEIDPYAEQPAQLPRSQPGPGEGQEDGSIVGVGMGEKLAELLGRVDPRLNSAEDAFGINRMLGRRHLADRVRVVSHRFEIRL